MHDPRPVFIAGGTGYIGRHCIPVLQQRGHAVSALARAASRHKLSTACNVVTGDALAADSYAAQVPHGCTFIHLVGVGHPSPAKARQFLSVDLASVQESLRAAAQAQAAHFVYLSVAQPAPVMAAYVNARQAAEDLITASGIPATFLRPWYVLGPGHRWPILLRPLYWAAERWPASAPTARRLGLVTITQMVNALVYATEHPAVSGQRVFDVPRIRACA